MSGNHGSEYETELVTGHWKAPRCGTRSQFNVRRKGHTYSHVRACKHRISQQTRRKQQQREALLLVPFNAPTKFSQYRCVLCQDLRSHRSCCVPCTTLAVPCTTPAVPCTTPAVPCTTLTVPRTTLAVPCITLTVPCTTPAVPRTTLSQLNHSIE